MDPLGVTRESDATISLGLRLWVALTLLVIVGTGLVYATSGPGGLQGLLQVGPASNLAVTLAAVAVAWLAVGALLALLRRPSIRAQHGLLLVGTFVLVLLYVNVLRERPFVGDARDYTDAARALSRGDPLNARYLYPPLLATVLEPFCAGGSDRAALGVLWGANIVAFAAFPALLAFTLRRYGVNQPTAVAVVLLALVVNVPLLRTLGYGQVNLHVGNCILLALLAHRRLPVVSALALALAVHLKMSPLLLVLPFVWEKDWKWLAWFGVALAGLALVTLVPYGPAPFWNVAGNIRHIYAANGINFRDNSFDSLFRSLAFIRGLAPERLAPLVTATRALVVGGIFWTAWLAYRKQLFGRSPTGFQAVHNVVPVLLLAMLLASPLLWEHHPVLVCLPFLLLAVNVRTPAERVWLAAAWVLVYLLPTFDFFPWSFGRLAGLIIVVVLIYLAARRAVPWAPLDFIPEQPDPARPA